MARFTDDFDDTDDKLSDDELLDDELTDDELTDDELLDDELTDDELLDDELVDNDIHTELFGANNKSMDKRERMPDKRKRRSQKQKKQRKIFAFGMMMALVLIIILGAITIISKYTPTNKQMTGYSYFEVSDSSDVLIMLNNEVVKTTGIYEDGRMYVPVDFVADKLNPRFYLDSESSSILYMDPNHSYSYKKNEKTYTDAAGKSYSEDFAISKEIGGKLYIDFEYVSRYSNFSYNYYEEPNRIMINNDFSEKQYVTVTKNTAVRYRGGIKSAVLENVKKDTKLIYNKSVDGWLEVRTDSGFLGYIKDNCASEAFSETPEKVHVDDFTSITKKYKISLGWFQVTNVAANNNIDSTLTGTQGLTTISPTWYSITGNNGDMSCLATKAFVDKMHAKGLEVWPLVDDFDTGLDGVALYSSKTARTKMINTLITDAKKYGYDGINLDCEKVTKDSAKHYLQFVRELSAVCRANNIVLSSDNYKSASSESSYYDLEEQAAFADYIIIMGYDEHYAGSESGSVASIGFVEEGITGALGQVPCEKLINAIPFYTRIWTVTTDGTGKATTTSKAVSMDTAKNDLEGKHVPAVWDEAAGQYFGSYESGDAVIKIWLEEKTSIEAKMKLMKQYNLAGVAMWKLGLESKDVWSVIAEYNQ